MQAAFNTTSSNRNRFLKKKRGTQPRPEITPIDD